MVLGRGWLLQSAAVIAALAGCAPAMTPASAPLEAQVRAPSEGAASLSLPEGFGAIGASCASAREEPVAREVGCGLGDRVAMIRMSTREVVELPSSATRQHRVMGDTMIYLENSRLWVSSVCVTCRVQAGSLLIGELALMTDEQIQAVQKELGLPDAPLLREPAQWREALLK